MERGGREVVRRPIRLPVAEFATPVAFTHDPVEAIRDGTIRFIPGRRLRRRLNRGCLWELDDRAGAWRRKQIRFLVDVTLVDRNRPVPATCPF